MTPKPDLLVERWRAAIEHWKSVAKYSDTTEKENCINDFESGYDAGRASRDAEVAKLKAEIQEQCRLNGMGGSRELKLVTEVKELKAEIERLRDKIENQRADSPGP